MAELKLCKAARKGDVKAMKKILNKGVGIQGKDSEGRTALHHAAEAGNMAAAQFLLDNKADIDAQDNHGMTALLRSVLACKEDMAFYLLKQGADPDILSNHDVSVWEKADILLPRSTVARMKSEAAIQRANRKPRVYAYVEPTQDTIKWGTKTISVPSSDANKTSTPATLSAATAATFFASSNDSGSPPVQHLPPLMPAPSPVKLTDSYSSSSPSSPSLSSSTSSSSSASAAPAGGFSYTSTTAPLSPRQPQSPPPPQQGFSSSASSSTSESFTTSQAFQQPQQQNVRSINLDELTEAVSMYISGAAAPVFTQEEMAIINASLKPMSLAFKNMLAKVDGFAMDLAPMEPAKQRALQVAAQNVSDSIRGLAPAVRRMNDDPGDPGAHKTMLEIAKKLVQTAYYFYTLCVAHVPNEHVVKTIQDVALATKALVKASLARQSDVALLKCARLTATNTIHLLKLANARMLDVQSADVQNKLAEHCHLIARATEGLIITAKTVFRTGGDSSTRSNLATLAKTLAEQYHKLTDLVTAISGGGGGMRGAHAVMPERMDETAQFNAAFKQLTAALARYNEKNPNAPPTVQREEQVLMLAREMMEEILILKDNLKQENNGGEMMRHSRALASCVSKIATIALNTSHHTSDDSLAEQLLVCLQDALHFSMQLKLAASARTVRVQTPQTWGGLAYSVRGMAAVVSLMVEAKLF
ncbi:Anaphase-promoting complex subunit 11 [Balamuthia mandrillaris]